MGKLTEDEIRAIVQKATLLQKFGESGSSVNRTQSNQELKSLYEITDNLDIPREYVHEAYLEQTGIPISEAFVVDNNDFSSTEIVGFAKGDIDKNLLKELRNQIEFHFNTVGEISYRKNKIVWKAKAVGPSKFIATVNSPEVEFKKVDGNVKIKVTQSLKTVNKLYLPAIAGGIGGFMFLTAIMFGVIDNDIGPALLMSALILTASFFFARFINGRKQKRKKNLLELSETLQGKIERHLKATTKNKDIEEKSPEIEIPENEYDEERVDSVINAKKQKE
ncbi:hypothetical protein [Gracilimonas sp.]|uniref:hypothetical protein n=1 Tax=Gracilimonas sp. TaxID=1974203 RepID=UPI00287203AB|nr:hypothetical protein [Gracilimonas sp.]